jgi:hypothetical protein
MKAKQRGVSIAILCVFYLGFAGYLFDRHCSDPIDWPGIGLGRVNSLALRPTSGLADRIVSRVSSRITHQLDLRLQILDRQQDLIDNFLRRHLGASEQVRRWNEHWQQIWIDDLERLRR